MAVEEIPAWFRIYQERLDKELRGLRRTVEKQWEKLDEIHTEQKKTNGTVKSHTSELGSVTKRLDRDEERDEDRKWHKGHIWTRIYIGSVSVCGFILAAVEFFLHVHP